MICQLQPYPIIAIAPHKPNYFAFKEQMASSLLFLSTKTTKQIVHHNPMSRQIDLSSKFIIHNPPSSAVSRRRNLNLQKTVIRTREVPLYQTL